MFAPKKTIVFFVALILLSGLVACQMIQSPSEDEVETPESTPDLQSIPTEFVAVQGFQVRQWAAEAEASSEYAVPEWSADQVVGSPDTNRCGDYHTAWATAGSDSVETLVLTYTLEVHVTAINIVQSFNPNQVVKVELLDSFGRPTEVYNQPPVQIDQICPYTLAIDVERTEKRFNHIRITVDQSVLGLGWNQIDAVELVGERQ